MQAWMHHREKELIYKHLDSNKIMLEWGSGGSTIEFSPKVKQYYSIEHNLDWFTKVNRFLKENNFKNVDYRFIQQNSSRTANQSQYIEFKDYIDEVDVIGEKYDIVLIDGRARRLCAYKIIPYLNPNAIIIVHDWVLRNVYHCITDYYDVLEYIDDTPQTIATFKLKEILPTDSYDLSLSGNDRLTENYFIL